MNLLQDIIDAVNGVGVLDVSADVDKNIVFVASLFLLYFSYLALRSVLRFFMNLGSKF